MICESYPDVRVATIDDAPGIAKVLVDVWRSTYTGILPAAFLDSFRYETHAAGTRQHLQDLPSSVAVLVAAAENRIVGVAHAKEAEMGPVGFAAELEALYVLPSLQGRHVGTTLFLRAVQWGQTGARLPFSRPMGPPRQPTPRFLRTPGR